MLLTLNNSLSLLNFVFVIPKNMFNVSEIILGLKLETVGNKLLIWWKYSIRVKIQQIINPVRLLVR